jgi:predicted amidohydrolase YtcJ
VAPDNPVWLTQTTGHYGVANSYALKMARSGATRRTQPAPSIVTPRAIRLACSGIGQPDRARASLTRDQQKRGIQQIVEDFNREGMTGAKDPGIGEQKWELYQELLKEGRLTVRVFALWSGRGPATPRR